MNARANAPRPRSAKPPKEGGAERKKGGRRCPICGKPSVQAYRPFCSKHCADIDLGRWLDGRYGVPGEPIGPENEQKERKD